MKMHSFFYLFPPHLTGGTTAIGMALPSSGARTKADGLFKVVEEGGDTLDGGLAFSLNLNLKPDACLADAAQIVDACQTCHQPNTSTGGHRTPEAHLVHAVVDHHL